LFYFTKRAYFAKSGAKLQLFFELTKYFADFSAVFGVLRAKNTQNGAVFMTNQGRRTSMLSI
jgi:hypothetical protein